MERIDIPIKPEELFPHIKIGVSKYDHLFELHGHTLRNSLRYQVYALHGTQCVCCGLKGTVFFLERQRPDDPFHLNLYGYFNGQEIMMTKDHIIPRSQGGKNRLDNLQPMCELCNDLKQDMPNQIESTPQQNYEISYRQALHALKQVYYAFGQSTKKKLPKHMNGMILGKTKNFLKYHEGDNIHENS